MKKITDRFLLGAIAGLGGNLAKMAVEQLFLKAGISKNTGAKTAAGIFLNKGDISSPLGKAVGIIGDNMIAAGLGVTCVYWATFMGKDNYFVKGAGLGAAEWTALYGVLSKLGATSIFPVKPQDALVGYLSHLAFGATKMAITVNLGDERLFKPKNIDEKIKKPQEISLRESAPGFVQRKNAFIK